MSWEAIGFKDCPFRGEPVSQETIALFVGHEKEIATCSEVISNKDVRIVIEGARGVGTTSFANYLRFTAQNKKLYFTPSNEIRVEANWNLETLLAAIITNLIREFELRDIKKVVKNKCFIEAKSLSQAISDTYKSFGLTAFGIGGSYGENAAISQPSIVPSPVLGHHLEDLAKLALDAGFKHGILIQLNNLDLGTIHTESHLKYLFNALRDYAQTPNVSWFFVGDVGIRSFIARRVDRLDDIISHEVAINPLTKKAYRKLIQKRIAFYGKRKNVTMPIQEEVFDYLYDVTEGRLRYIFGLLNRMFSQLQVGSLINSISVDIAAPLIAELAKNRIRKHSLTTGEEEILAKIVELGSINVTELVAATNKARPFVSNSLGKLLKLELVTVKKLRNLRIYKPLIDAKIAYGKI
jgi:hypothetical protein